MKRPDGNPVGRNKSRRDAVTASTPGITDLVDNGLDNGLIYNNSRRNGPGLVTAYISRKDFCFHPRKPEIARLQLRLMSPGFRLVDTVLEKSGENWFQD
jgi:hypothetical protein